MKSSFFMIALLSLPAMAQERLLPDFGLGPASRPGAVAPAAELVSVNAIVSHSTAAPGQTIYVALDFGITDGFVVYSPTPGKDVRPLQITVTAPAGLQVGELLYPPAHDHAFPGNAETHKVYSGRVAVFIPITVAQGTAAGTYPLKIEVDGQACSASTCVPLSAEPAAAVTVGPTAAKSPGWIGWLQDQFSQSRTLADWGKATKVSPCGETDTPWSAPGQQLSAWAGLGLALLAGLILNIMPCVLPVIPLKVISILQQAKQSAHKFEVLGLLYAAGIVLFFVGLAVLNGVLRGIGCSFRWGDHFRYPQFVIGMALLMVALAMNLFGLYTVLVPNSVAAAQPRRGYLGAIGAGMLTALLSTPCSFAILTFAFAWTLAQPLWLGTIGILCIGLGMASPYALLTAFPSLVSRIPKAGLWTELFKQTMGFVMLLVAAWLLGTQMKDTYVAWVLAYAVVLAMCLWIWGSWLRYDAPASHKWSIRLLAIGIAVGAGLWMLTPPKPLATKFEPFTEAAFTEARAEGKTVLIDFTATWCLTCKTVEERVYNSGDVAEAVDKQGIVAFRGDVSTKDLPAVKLLNQLREPGVPVTVIFPPGSAEPIRLYGIFSKADLFKALDQARQPATAPAP